MPEIVRGLREGSSLVLEAPPGAGKTTRVPRALDDARIVDGQILVLEPRRLAARMAAARVAEEHGEPVGRSVGYRVRFEEAVSAATRVLFVTDGVLIRRLYSSPRLDGIGAVVLDEFHERHLQADLALALCRRIQQSRPDFKLVAMSATLDAAPIARFLGDCPVLRAEGRRFEVTLEHDPPATGKERPLEAEVARALRGLIATGLDGDVLVFLPGAAEIRRAAAACAELARAADLELVPLHGDLSPEAQARAVRPGPRRKVILSTNVAETSITVEGVVAVIDSGLHRAAACSPWSGLQSLKVQRISRASATQRAGRAGRLRPGRCHRLYSRHDHDTRPEHDLPEVRRLDLAETVLLLAASGANDPAAFEWFEAPPAAALEAARELNVRLGALSPEGALTPLGRRLVQFPLHPRQARVLVEAESRGLKQGCLLAALLGEGGIVARGAPGRAESGPADLLADLDRFAEAARARFDPDRLRSFGLDVGRTLAVDKVRRQLERLIASSPQASGAARGRTEGASDRASSREVAEEIALGMCLLAGYPDRVARRRKKGGRELVLASGGGAELAESSVVKDAELLIAIDAEERSAQGARGLVTVRSASAIEPEWLLELCADRLRDTALHVWNPAAERVEVVKRLAYEQLILDEVRRPAEPGPETARVLLSQATARGARNFEDGEALDRLLGRIGFLRTAAPELALPELGPSELDDALGALCESAVSFAELDGALTSAIAARLDGRQRRALDELAPERVTLAGGRAVRVSYTPGQPPWIASRLQDFVGMAAGPTGARGRVPLTLHLLAPNQRAVQVTSDLAGFWQRHYPAIRRELGRRYPRHPWPEDPLTARPPSRR